MSYLVLLLIPDKRWNDPLNTLMDNMRFLCDEARMLTGIAVAYGTPDSAKSALYGRAQEADRISGAFIPCERSLTADSLFDLASLTKLFTAVATMQLVHSGKLSLDEYVGRIDSRFVHLRDVTVGDVLGFTVSLQTPGRIDTAPDQAEGFRRLFGVSTCPTPAVRVYSDINAMVIKYIIEAKTGLSFYDVLKERVFSPAGMRETFAHVPADMRNRCVCYNYEHRIEGERFILREDVTPGTPHDPKALLLSGDGSDLCGHAGLFSTRADMVRFAQALLAGELLPLPMIEEIGTNRTGLSYGDGTYRQYLGYLCFAKHPYQHLSEVPEWMSDRSVGLSGFTGNHLSIDPQKRRFVLFLGNRCHMRVSHIIPPKGMTLEDYDLDARGVGTVCWPDGRLINSSAKYVYFKDERLHAPIAKHMRELGWI